MSDHLHEENRYGVCRICAQREVDKRSATVAEPARSLPERWGEINLPGNDDAQILVSAKEWKQQRESVLALQAEVERLKDEATELREYKNDGWRNFESIRAELALAHAANAKLRQALESYPKFPTECDHDNEAWYCDGCRFQHEKAVKAWHESSMALLSERP